MNSTLDLIRSLGIAIIASLALTITAAAQPHGWQCDYGFRPGNVWFYPSPFFPGLIVRHTVVRDSTGGDGAYWVYVSPSTGTGWWYRIDSTCTFNKYRDPSDARVKLWFKSRAGLGDTWIVDGSFPESVQRARIDTTRDRQIFGMSRPAKWVNFFHTDPVAEIWDQSEEWVPKFGIVSRYGEPSGHEELVGAIIDGVAYGVTSGVDEPASDAAGSVAIYPLPASDRATLAITARGERRASIEIHDILGRPVRRDADEPLRDGLNAIHLDVTGLAPGSYLVTVDIDGTRCTRAMVVAR